MTSLIENLSKFYQLAHEVKKRESKPYSSQLIDLVTLYRKNPTCNLWDYYRYRIYKSPRGSRLYTQTLGLNYLEPFSKSLNPRHVVTPAWDKILFSIVCDAYKIPSSPIYALYKKDDSIPVNIKTALTTIDDIKTYLAEISEPVFFKPVKSTHGEGAYCISNYDSKNNIITTTDGLTFNFEDFINKTINNTYEYYNPRSGYLFQKPIKQHSEITEFTGISTPSGFRFVVLNKGDQPIIHRVMWKLVLSSNINDNFSHGKRGNMLSRICPKTGKPSSAVTCTWPYTEYKTHHPQTQNAFSQFSIPNWNEVKNTVIVASRAFSDFGILHWDIIISDEGPIFLELNDLGGTNILQMHEQGVIDETMASYMKKFSNLDINKDLKNLISKIS